MSVLVTGGTGFVGLNVVEELIARRESVIVLDSRPLPDQFLKLIAPNRHLIHFEQIDVTDQVAVKSVFSRHVISHLFLGAAIPAGPQRERDNPQSVVDVNLQGNLNILQEAARQGLKRVVFPSSLTVYGASLHDREIVEETQTPPVPESIYGITKYAAERAVLRMAQLLNFEAVAGRIGSVFGPWETFTGARDLVSPFAQISRACVLGETVVLPDRYPRREMIYSRDLARALVLLMFVPRLGHEVYNLSTNVIWTSAPEAWCEALAKKFPAFRWDHTKQGLAATIDYYDARDRGSLSTDRISKDLGFSSSFDLRRSIEDYSEWLQQNQQYFQRS